MPNTRIASGSAFVSKHDALCCTDPLPEWTLFASDMGWAPGVFPAIISTDIGNGQPFDLRAVDTDGTHHYTQRFGCTTLVVYND